MRSFFTLMCNINGLKIKKRQILDLSKLKEFADDNLEFDENGTKFSITLLEKENLLVMSNLSFFHIVFKTLVH